MSRTAIFTSLAVILSWSPCGAFVGAAAAVPGDFPEFIVPGQERSMGALREMFHLHYREYAKRSRPMATLWDEWLSGSTLWPAVDTDGLADKIERGWREGLSSRHLDPEGYVATHQHSSIAHQEGWPFPFWQQGKPGTWGWHFSLRGVPHNWDGSPARTQEGWLREGAEDRGIADERWNVELTQPRARITAPPLLILPEQSPFIQLRWRTEGMDRAQPVLEWATEDQPEFGPDRRFCFDVAPAGEKMVYAMIPVYKSPAWKGRITRLRLSFNNPEPGGRVGIQALFTQYDTRHNVNNTAFIRGCCQYFHWTGDVGFLRANLQRMRLAMRYAMETLVGSTTGKCIISPFPGHDGRSGIERTADGRKIIHSGRGTGNNYWDILPMGYQDAYATIQYYDALLQLARLEDEIALHPEWNLPAGPPAFEGDALRGEAQTIKSFAGKLFWNDETGRFVAGIDMDGVPHDYGFTFINCEAVYYGFATTEQAESILQWLSGERTVAGDTSQGADIYHWRFGPRATTKRNIDWYGWYWYDPESLPWGGQVQDGGAVLGFSYHDLQARLKTHGADDAWQRLSEIAGWFEEVQAGGGYRAYYKDRKGVTLQGCGTCGGLGLDCEFYESILLPQIMVAGFLGFEPRGDGFAVNPRLPKDWPSLTVTRIRFQGLILDVTVDRQSVTIRAAGHTIAPLSAYLPEGAWKMEQVDAAGKVVTSANVAAGDAGHVFNVQGQATMKFVRP